MLTRPTGAHVEYIQRVWSAEETGGYLRSPVQRRQIIVIRCRQPLTDALAAGPAAVRGTGVRRAVRQQLRSRAVFDTISHAGQAHSFLTALSAHLKRTNRWLIGLLLIKATSLLDAGDKSQ